MASLQSCSTVVKVLHGMPFPLICGLFTESSTGIEQCSADPGNDLFRQHSTKSHCYTAHTSINMMLSPKPGQWDRCQLELLKALCMHDAPQPHLHYHMLQTANTDEAGLHMRRK